MPTWRGESVVPHGRLCLPLSLLSLPPLYTVSALFSFLFALPFVPDAVFNCFASVYLLFIYVSFHLHCLFSVAYAAAVDDQADNLIVSLCVYLSPPLLYSLSLLIIMFFACKVQCQQRASDKQRGRDRETGA